LAYLGHKVICVDKDKIKIQRLKKGIVPIFEPGLEEFLKKHRKDIDFTTYLKDAIKKAK